ncbi:ParB N-terminal domain-containing protein [Nocardia sp. NPDC127526]|uniref:ParB N-terminal domain-containing protein n=1 Tax=Nocardia sp. NPDC127526 TaxID=3345393 RepID=UPI003626C242
MRIPLYRLRIESMVRKAGEVARHIDALSDVAAALPPIVVHRPRMTVIDGLHRVRAAQACGAQWIDAVYFDGDDGQAFLLAVQLNNAHGLPLSTSDRKAAAERALTFYPAWSNRKLGEVVGLPERVIADIRKRSAEAAQRRLSGVSAISRRMVAG